jgi:hypothetical protein
MKSMITRAGVAGVALVLSIVACTSSTPSGPAGGAVTGAQDDHCGATKNPTSQASCQPAADAGAGDSGDAGHSHADDAGEPDGGASEYGATMFNQSGAEDDCKYDISWTASPVYRDTDVTFTVTVKARVDGAPVTGAEPDVEAFLDATHPAPSSGSSTEKGGGVYTIGPVRFDKAGRWTVRFHFFDRCVDGPTSPHGHAAFFVNVP